jgi:hypothetical protein
MSTTDKLTAEFEVAVHNLEDARSSHDRLNSEAGDLRGRVELADGLCSDADGEMQDALDALESLTAEDESGADTVYSLIQTAQNTLKKAQDELGEAQRTELSIIDYTLDELSLELSHADNAVSEAERLCSEDTGQLLERADVFAIGGQMLQALRERGGDDLVDAVEEFVSQAWIFSSQAADFCTPSDHGPQHVRSAVGAMLGVLYSAEGLEEQLYAAYRDAGRAMDDQRAQKREAHRNQVTRYLQECGERWEPPNMLATTEQDNRRYAEARKKFFSGGE